ncbi:MAG: VIT domain-containing protein, partial [Planctomycetota bacterium]|nr:VIT domain-containing protein [Planctomycetota bacterium]
MIKKLILACLIISSLPSSAFAIGRMRDKDVHLDIDSLRIRVLIEESHTSTEVDHVFRNHSNRAAEAAFDFPLPQRATFSGLSIWVNGEEVQGEVVEQKRARSIYTAITGIRVDEIRKPDIRAESRKRPPPIPKAKDPGLLQLHGRLLRLRVAPVPANGFHRVRVRYVEPTQMENGQGRYVFPMAFDGISAVKTKRLSFQVRVQSQRLIDRVWTPSHKNKAILQTKRSGHIFEMSLDEKNVTLNKDFECRYQSHRQSHPEIQVHCSEQAAQITITPRIHDSFNNKGRDIIFLVDSSKSMWRHLYELRKAFDGFHSFLREQDRFNVISFNLGATLFRPKMQNLKNVRREDLSRYFARQKYSYQADPTVALCALKQLLKKSGKRGRPIELVLITDAQFSDQPRLIRAMTLTAQNRKLRCFALELGKSRHPQRPLTQFTEKTGGSCFAASNNNSESIAQDLLQALYSPVL